MRHLDASPGARRFQAMMGFGLLPLLLIVLWWFITHATSDDQGAWAVGMVVGGVIITIFAAVNRVHVAVAVAAMITNLVPSSGSETRALAARNED